MFFLLRRTFMIGAAVTLLGVFVFGRSAASYLSTACGWVKESVKNSVPLDFEIDRARRMVKDLVPDIRKNMHVIAKEEVEIERLQQQIKDAEARQDKDRTELTRLKNDASTGNATFKYSGRTYTIQQVKADLTNRFERCKTGDATLASLHEIYDARVKSLEAARQKLEGMLAARRKLEADVENLEARLKMVEVAQTASEHNFDDSQLGRVKELIVDLRTRLDVSERMVNVEGSLHDEIPVSEPTPTNILEQVTEYLGVDGPKVAETAQK
jgi:chromosome segregation ATPase